MIPIQGTDAVLSFLKDEYLPYVCASNMTVEIETDEIATRTVGDGNWKKTDYQAIGFTISLGGVLVFDDTNFDSWEIMLNHIGFLPIGFRINFTDENGTTESMQGTVIVKSSQLTSSIGQVVKGTFSLGGTGVLTFFDGLVPCATTIDSITVNGQEGNAGIVTVDYDYTGDLYQVTYQIDGAGSWFFALGGAEISIPGLALGAHSIQIIPICSNGFQGTGLSQSFNVTQSLSCPTTITAVTVNTGTLTATVTVAPGGTATQMIYYIAGGIGVPVPQTVPIGSVISFPGISAGNWAITCIPLCTFPNGQSLQGTGTTQNFTVAAQPTQAILNYSFANTGASLQGFNFQIYVNNILTVVGSPGASGSINVPVGATIRAAMNGTAARTGGYTPPVSAELIVRDVTTNTVLASPVDDGIIVLASYSFVASPHTYSITETFSA